ncbi:MAG: hypothetical protein SVV80_01295 [Planctomycetota bacterium]|nr:hypothetical protein [Planctomycetota bacterium]
MPGYSRIEMYARLLMVVPLVLLFLFILIISVIVILKWQIWRMSKRRAERLAHMTRFRPDGLPYPPSGRGMCDVCEKAHEKVYHLPSGRRLCADCYESLEMTPAGDDDCIENPPQRRTEDENAG